MNPFKSIGSTVLTLFAMAWAAVMAKFASGLALIPTMECGNPNFGDPHSCDGYIRVVHTAYGLAIVAIVVTPIILALHSRRKLARASHAIDSTPPAL